MRTTLDLPDPIFRDLKSRAAQQGMKLKELVQQYVEDGLRAKGNEVVTAPVRSPLPNFRPGMNVKIPALTNAELYAILDGEDIERHERLFSR